MSEKVIPPELIDELYIKIKNRESVNRLFGYSYNDAEMVKEIKRIIETGIDEANL